MRPFLFFTTTVTLVSPSIDRQIQLERDRCRWEGRAGLWTWSAAPAELGLGGEPFPGGVWLVICRWSWTAAGLRGGRQSQLGWKQGAGRNVVLPCEPCLCTSGPSLAARPDGGGHSPSEEAMAHHPTPTPGSPAHGQLGGCGRHLTWSNNLRLNPKFTLQ